MNDINAADAFDVVDLDGELVPAGAMIEAKQEAIHWITVLVIGWYPSSDQQS